MDCLELKEHIWIRPRFGPDPNPTFKKSRISQILVQALPIFLGIELLIKDNLASGLNF